MSKIKYDRNSAKLRGKEKDSLEIMDVATELKIAFKKQFKDRLKERKKEREDERLRIKSIFKKGKSRIIRKGKIID